MRDALKFIEWTLIILIGGYLILIFFPHKLIETDEHIQQFKREGIYQAVSSDAQSYYGSRVWVKGIAYGNGQLSVHMRGIGFGEKSKVPYSIKVITDQGDDLGYAVGGGGGTDLWSARYRYVLSNVPDGIKQITIMPPENFINGDNFSFTVDLKGGTADGDE